MNFMTPGTCSVFDFGQLKNVVECVDTVGVTGTVVLLLESALWSINPNKGVSEEAENAPIGMKVIDLDSKR